MLCNFVASLHGHQSMPETAAAELFATEIGGVLRRIDEHIDLGAHGLAHSRWNGS